jgi:hypothetical protein
MIYRHYIDAAVYNLGFYAYRPEKVQSRLSGRYVKPPLEHVRLLVEPIENRNCQFRPYGIAITKVQGRNRCSEPRSSEPRREIIADSGPN